MLTLGIAGAGGYWGRRVLQTVVEIDGVHVARCSAHSNLDRLARVVAERFPAVAAPVVQLGERELIDDEAIDALVIATPAESHYAIARDGLAHGKHVFLEKPMCLSGREARDLVQLAGKTGNVLFVDHTYVFSKCVEFMKAQVDEGVLGQPLFFRANRSQIGIYRPHSVLWDLAPHDLSIVRFLFPDEQIDRVDCRLRSHFTEMKAWAGNSDVVADEANYVLEFTSGLQASGFMTWCHPKWSRDVAIVGTNGMLLFEHNTTVRRFRSRSARRSAPNRATWEQVEQYVPEDNPLRRALSAFCRAVESRAVPLPRHMQPEFGLWIVETMESLHRSARRGKRSGEH